MFCLFVLQIIITTTISKHNQVLQSKSIKENHRLADTLLGGQLGEGGGDLCRGEDGVQDRLELASLDRLGDVLERQHTQVGIDEVYML